MTIFNPFKVHFISKLTYSLNTDLCENEEIKNENAIASEKRLSMSPKIVVNLTEE